MHCWLPELHPNLEPQKGTISILVVMDLVLLQLASWYGLVWGYWSPYVGVMVGILDGVNVGLGVAVPVGVGVEVIVGEVGVGVNVRVGAGVGGSPVTVNRVEVTHPLPETSAPHTLQAATRWLQNTICIPIPARTAIPGKGSAGIFQSATRYKGSPLRTIIHVVV